MYESYFGLTRHPFSAAPDVGSCAGVATMKDAFESLTRCLAEGHGIGIVTSPPGLGKTILCRTVAEELADSFATVSLPNSNFSTRRSLLQAILCELARPYVRMSEQELRLELFSAVRALRPQKIGVALLIDEAHLLSNELLEEARTLTNLLADGDSLVRLLLSGQLALEENLASPALEALNQRIGCHVTLEPLTRQESAEYIAFRLNQAGADPGRVFSTEALSLICHAGDGVPRCLNQLCDRSLLLACLAQERPVGPETVRTALDDLKQLPLHWNELPPAQGSEEPTAEQIQPDQEIDGSPMDETSPCASDDVSDDLPSSDDRLSDVVFECGEPATECIEIGGDPCTPSSGVDSASIHDDHHPTEISSVEMITTLEISESATESDTFEIGADPADNSAPVEENPPESVATGTDSFSDEPLVDPYARLDAGLARSGSQVDLSVADATETQRAVDDPSPNAADSPPEQHILTTDLESSTDAEPSGEPPADEVAGYSVRYEYDVVHPEPEETRTAGTETAQDAHRIDQPADRSTSRRRQYDELVRELRRRYRKQA